MNKKSRPRLIPLNLPAGIAHQVAGNPATTRLESTPANCFPGLDADIRNLDRRFFPGLIFEFEEMDNPLTRGALLIDTDVNDPDLPAAGDLADKVSALASMLAPTLADRSLPAATILLDSVESGGNKVSLIQPNGTPYGPNVAWRVVRSLEQGPVTIGLSRFDGTTRIPLMELTGNRRIYQNEHGEWPSVYHAGEMTQSLCSPWQHDFRDCACTYWASNHPDIVMAAHPMDIAEVDDPGPEQDRAADPIIWMRWDADARSAPRGTFEGCRPSEMDHYETNRRWDELNFVLEGREQLTPWLLSSLAEPDPTTLPMLPRLKKLAGVEQALALEYLYARYTVRFYDPLPGEAKNHAVFIAHELLNVAIGEMMHLRWVNELLARLRRRVGKTGRPVLRVGKQVPWGEQQPDKGRDPRYERHWRLAVERPLDQAIEDFVNAEAPSASLEGLYARILVKLKEGWPNTGEVDRPSVELVERIIADGVDHYEHFREIQALLNRPEGRGLVQRLENVKAGSAEFAKAEKLYEDLVDGLMEAYGSKGGGKAPAAAITAMKNLDIYARELATRKPKPLGIPFLEIANKVADAKRLP